MKNPKKMLEKIFKIFSGSRGSSIDEATFTPASITDANDTAPDVLIGDSGDVIDESEIGREPGVLPQKSEFESGEIARFRVIEYDSDGYTLDEFSDVEDLRPFAQKQDAGVVWIQVLGLKNAQTVVPAMGELFDIPHLAQEDIFNIWSRPKFEEYGDDMILAITRAVRLNDLESLQPKGQQIAFIVGKNFLISFHEKRDLIFENIETRIATNSGKIRNWRSPYLLYVLVDALVDRILLLTDEIDEAISDLEDEAIKANDNENETDGEDTRSIYHLKRLVIRHSRQIKPLSEMVRKMRTIDHKILPEEMDRYFDDLYDHAQRAFDRLDHSRVILQELQDFYQGVNMRHTNKIIRRLTLVTFIFIPITFVTGFFGMNFELPTWLADAKNWVFILALCLVASVGSLIFFRTKRWF